MDWTTGDLFGSCGAGQDCGDDDTMADPNGSRYAFSGNTQDLETWGEGYVSTLDGMYVATDAQARPTAILFGSYPEPYWSMSILGNPHLDVDGNPVRGSFNAWMPPTYFASLGTDAETAAATGFDVVSREGADSVSLPATVAVQDGGVAIDVPDLGYSVHSIDVIGHASTAGVGVATPDAPGRVAVRPVSGGLGVSWAAPASDGNTPITSYTARAFTAPTGGAIAGRCAATTTSCAITGLTVGTTYYVAVSATNALGEGSSATPRAAGTAVDLPSAPRAVTLAPGNGRLVASWLAPRSAGAAPLTRGTPPGAYLTRTGGDPVRSCVTAAGKPTCTLVGLTNGTRYFVAVTAATALGDGLATVRPQSAPRTVPSTPRKVTLRTGDGQLTASWLAPQSSGGSPVTGYTVRAYPSATSRRPASTCIVTVATRSCVLGGLIDDRTYYVAVVAANAAGVGLATDRTTGTPRHPPFWTPPS
jgi:hypothetical protein